MDAKINSPFKIYNRYDKIEYRHVDLVTGKIVPAPVKINK